MVLDGEEDVDDATTIHVVVISPQVFERQKKSKVIISIIQITHFCSASILGTNHYTTSVAEIKCWLSGHGITE